MIEVKQAESLVAYAIAARATAYAPYSKYLVGAAALMQNGETYTGCNVENASYGLTICAERTALVKAVSNGQRQIQAIAIATSGGGTPCGACRQFIAEFAQLDTVVIVHDVDADQGGRMFTMNQLLPEAFGLSAAQAKHPRHL